MLASIRAAGVPGSEKRSDYETCVNTVREARRIMRDYINPCIPSDAAAAIDKLIEALDSEAVDAALRRIDGRNHFGLVWNQSEEPSRF
jgi:hypothetical protein